MSVTTNAPAFIPPSATVTDYGIGPKAAQKRDASKANWSVTRIDRLSGGRNNLILVCVTNPKKPGSKADTNWGLYGKQDNATVPVGDFLKAYPGEDGGLSRARASLAYDLNYGYVKIVDANGNVIEA